MVSLSAVSGGNAVGLIASESAGGGAADVGNSWLISTVAVASIGAVGDGDGVSVVKTLLSSDKTAWVGV